MCGIFCSLSNSARVLPNKQIQERLENRGPDSTRTECTVYEKFKTYGEDRPEAHVQITFFSTVLSLRGAQTVRQPYQDISKRFTLCWNGEAWGVGCQSTPGNDTEVVHALLASVFQDRSPPDLLEGPIQSASRVAKALSQITGPYAFTFFDHGRGRLFFGRDFLGRRSLLRRIGDNGELIISSLSDGDSSSGWTEIEADGIYCVDLYVADKSNICGEPEVLTWGHFIACVAPYGFANLSGHNNTSNCSVGLSSGNAINERLSSCIGR